MGMSFAMTLRMTGETGKIDRIIALSCYNDR